MLGLIRRFLDKWGVVSRVKRLGQYRRRESDYGAGEICLSLLYSLMMGIFRPSHMMELTSDKVFQKIVGLKRFPVQSTISRFLGKITVHKALHIAEINSRSLNRIRKGFQDLQEITLDLDSHVIPVFGKQHRAKKGYNPKKRGRKSYHPLLCFLGETRDYLGGVLRPGNSTSGDQARAFLALMLRKLPNGAVSRLRADSGFFSLEFIRWVWLRGIEFYIVVPQQIWVQKLILHITNWRHIDKGLAVGEISLPLNTLKQVRLVVIRKAIKKGEKPKKQLKLLGIQEVVYDYQVIATSSDKPEEEVWCFYNQRACCENFIKEGIYGFGLDKSVCRSWAGAKLYFELVMLAYNLTNWFKEIALGFKKKKEMAWTIRWKLLWIPAKLVNRGRRLKLKLAAWWTYQEEFRRAQAALT